MSDEVQLRTQCEVFIKRLESSLSDQNFLFGDKLSLADLAILPFARQFVNVEKSWFRSAGYPQLSCWLAGLLQSLLFSSAMRKYPLWLENRQEFLLTWK